MTKHVVAICVIMIADIVGVVIALQMCAHPGDWWLLGGLGTLVMLGAGSIFVIHPNVKKILAYFDSEFDN